MEKESIIEFSKEVDKSKAQSFYEKILNILTSALDDLLREYKGVLNFDEDTTRIFPNGDYTNDTFIDETGELEIIFASKNQQLVISNNIYSREYLKLKNKPKKLKDLSRDGTYENFIIQYVNFLAPYFDENTIILLTNDGLKVLCLDEYGFKILIRFATYNDADAQAILYFWQPLDKKSIPVNLFLYNDNMEQKNTDTHGNYKKIVRILKNIRKTILLNKWTNNSSINKYFIELIAYNIPNELLLGNDIYAIFIKVINFLTNCNIYDFISFDNTEITNFRFAKVSYYNIKNFINYLLSI